MSDAGITHALHVEGNEVEQKLWVIPNALIP